MGLGYLAAAARRVFGGDIDPKNLAFAVETHASKTRIGLLVLDAHSLPFADRSLDVVILFDSIYFLRDASRFVSEAFRVLRGSGTLLVSTVNCNWKEFNPSHKATRYFTASELKRLLESAGFRVRAFGGFRAEDESAKTSLVNAIRRLAVKWRLVPTNVRAKELVKRLFLGPLTEFGAEVRDDMAPLDTLTPIEAVVGDSPAFKILYLEAAK
jgi:SAM-dependent methyltransferase